RDSVPLAEHYRSESLVTGIAHTDLARHYPRLFHMAEAGCWPSVQRYGLLSTSGLLDLFEVDPEQRVQLESRHRPESVRIQHPVHGTAVIRDQKPMSDSGLK